MIFSTLIHRLTRTEAYCASLARGRLFALREGAYSVYEPREIEGFDVAQQFR